jgi:hypothetical protein
MPALCCADSRCPTTILDHHYSRPRRSFVPKSRARAGETDAVVRLSDDLSAALRAVIDSSPLAGLGPIEVGRIAGVDKTFASRLMSALRTSDSLVALSLLPGVVPLRQFIAAARERGAASRAVLRAERALRAFDLELQRSFGTRTRLDAVLADALPEARRRHEDGARQAVYRGMAMIKGVSIDLECNTWIVHPSRRNPKRVDALFLAAFIGIHRLRPTARVRLAASHRGAEPKGGAKLLRQFCRPAGVSISSTADKDYTFYEISTGRVTRDSAAEVFLTELHEGIASRAGPKAEKREWAVGDVVTYPIKRLDLTILVHADVWSESEFALRAYDTAGRGLVTPDDPERDFDRLSLHATVLRSPATIEALRASPVPHYTKVLRHLMAPLGWSLETPSGRPAFRMITCEIAYPLYGSQLMLGQE